MPSGSRWRAESTSEASDCPNATRSASVPLCHIAARQCAHHLAEQGRETRRAVVTQLAHNLLDRRIARKPRNGVHDAESDHSGGEPATTALSQVPAARPSKTDQLKPFRHSCVNDRLLQVPT
jgi:hypothetical protein